MKSFRYVYGVICIAGLVTTAVMTDAPMWGRIIISALFLIPLVGNEYQIHKAAKSAAEEANLTNGVEDKILHEYRESSRD